MIEPITILIGAAFPLMASPGPATVGVAASGAAFGFAASRPYLIGICAGTMTLMGCVVAGLTSVLAAVPGLRTTVALFAIAYMIWLAYRIATAPPVRTDGTSDRAPSFAGGYMLALANPKAFAAFASATAAVRVAPDAPIVDGITKFAVLTVMIWTINTTWLVFGSSFATGLTTPRTSRIINIAFATLMLISVAFAGMALL